MNIGVSHGKFSPEKLGEDILIASLHSLIKFTPSRPRDAQKKTAGTEEVATPGQVKLTMGCGSGETSMDFVSAAAA